MASNPANDFADLGSPVDDTPAAPAKPAPQDFSHLGEPADEGGAAPGLGTAIKNEVTKDFPNVVGVGKQLAKEVMSNVDKTKDLPIDPASKLGYIAQDTIQGPFDLAGNKTAEALAYHGLNPYFAAGIGFAVQQVPAIAFTEEGEGAIKASGNAEAEGQMLESIMSKAMPKQLGYNPAEVVPDLGPISAPTTILEGGESAIPLGTNRVNPLEAKKPLLIGSKTAEGEDFIMRDTPDLALQQGGKGDLTKSGAQPTYPGDIASKPKGTKTYYHVTSSEAASKIKQQGLIGSSHDDLTGGGEMSFPGSDEPRVHFFDNAQDAKSFAKKSFQSKDAQILKVNLPKEIYSKLKPDTMAVDLKNAYYYTGDIGQEHLQSEGSLLEYAQRKKLSSHVPDYQKLTDVVAPADHYNPVTSDLVDESRRQYQGYDPRVKIERDPATGKAKFSLIKDVPTEKRVALEPEVAAARMTKESPVVQAMAIDPKSVDVSPVLPGSDQVPVLKPNNVAGSSSWLQTTWNRLGSAAEDVVGKMGQPGKELAADIRQVRDVPQVRYGDFIADFDKFFKGMTKVQAKAVNTAISDVLEGKTTGVKLPAGLIEFVQGKFKTIADEASNIGLKIANSAGDKLDWAPRENYFPHVFRQDILDGLLAGDDKTMSQIAESMVKNKQEPSFNIAFERVKYMRNKLSLAKYGHLEVARELDIPSEFYDRNSLRVIPEYMRSALHRIEEARVFGPQGEKALEKIDAIAQAGYDHGLARRIIERFTGIEPRDTLALQASQGLRNLTAGMFIQWQTTLKHLPQYLVPAYEASISQAVKGYARAWTELGAEEAQRAGQVFNRSAMEYVSEVYGGAPGGTKGFAQGVFKLNGLTKLINFLKKYSSLTGRDYLEHTLVPTILKNPGNKKAILDLEALGFDAQKIVKAGGLSDLELKVGAKRFTDNVTGAVDSTRLPHFWSSPTGKFFAQFKNLSFTMGRENLSLVRRAVKTGDVARLSKMMIGAEVSGYAVKKALEATGLQDPSQFEITGNETVDGLVEDLSHGLLWGPVVDLAMSAMRGPDHVKSYFTPPALSQLSEVISATGQLIKGNPTPFAKAAVKRVPIIGRVLKNRMFE